MTASCTQAAGKSPPRVSSPRVLSGTPAVKTGQGLGHTQEPACWLSLADSPQGRGTWAVMGTWVPHLGCAQGVGRPGLRGWALAGVSAPGGGRASWPLCGPQAGPGVDCGPCAERGRALCPLPGTVPWGHSGDFSVRVEAPSGACFRHPFLSGGTSGLARGHRLSGRASGRLRLRGSRPRGEVAGEGPWSWGGLRGWHRLGGPRHIAACTGQVRALLCRAGRPPRAGAWPGLRNLPYLRPSGFLSRLFPPLPLAWPIWNLLPLVSAAKRPVWWALRTGTWTLFQPEPPCAAQGLWPAWGQRGRACCGGAVECSPRVGWAGLVFLLQNQRLGGDVVLGSGGQGVPAWTWGWLRLERRVARPAPGPRAAPALVPRRGGWMAVSGIWGGSSEQPRVGGLSLCPAVGHRRDWVWWAFPGGPSWGALDC